MTEPKTKENNADPVKFIKSLEDKKKIDDSLKFLKLFREVTGEKPKMWGSHIIGFGKYHYKSERSTQEGDWPLTGFSPGKQAFSIYIMSGANNYKDLTKELGKCKISGGGACIYVKNFEDINSVVLKKLIKKSYTDMKKKYKI